MSSGRPNPSGRVVVGVERKTPPAWFCRNGCLVALGGTAISPGATQLTRTPCRAASKATSWVSAMTPAFEAAYPARCVVTGMAATGEMVSTEPVVRPVNGAALFPEAFLDGPLRARGVG